MTQPDQMWTNEITDVCTRLNGAPTTGVVYDALGLAWQTSKAVTTPTSPANELRWMRLTESLLDTWHTVAARLGVPPTAVPFDAVNGKVPADLADSAAVHAHIARLVTAAAAAIRHLATGDSADQREVLTAAPRLPQQPPRPTPIDSGHPQRLPRPPFISKFVAWDSAAPT